MLPIRRLSQASNTTWDFRYKLPNLSSLTGINLPLSWPVLLLHSEHQTANQTQLETQLHIRTVNPFTLGSVEEGKKIKLNTDAVDMCSRLRSHCCLYLTSCLSEASETIHCSFTPSLYLLIYSLKKATFIVETFNWMFIFNTYIKTCDWLTYSCFISLAFTWFSSAPNWSTAMALQIMSRQFPSTSLQSAASPTSSVL